jgi:DNA polymerase-3 subunit delta
MAESGWNSQRLSDSIARGEIYPLYFFHGDETYLIDEAMVALEMAAIGEGLRDFNLNTFYGQEADPSQIRDAVETLPMMSKVRLVVIKDAQELSEKDWDLLMPLIDEPVPSTALICIASKVDKRKKYMKRFLEGGIVIEFKRPFENQIPDWIRSIARKHDLKLGSDAVDLIHQLVGSNLSDINAEIKKLAGYVGEKKQAGVDEVLQVVSRVRLDSVFDLTDAIGQNDRVRALDCLVNLLENGQNEVGVLALISRHVRILKLVSDGLKEGLSGGRLSSRAGVAPYFLKSYVDQSQRWNVRKTETTFKALLDTDRALKSSPVAAHIWLENFIIQTCG